MSSTKSFVDFIIISHTQMEESMRLLTCVNLNLNSPYGNILDMSVPVVIIHIGNQPYFRSCVLLNARYNKVIVLGNSENKNITDIPNVEHYDINTLDSPELGHFQKNFTNYSTNSASYEFICFARIFYVKRILELKGLDAVFHMDSDCILLEKLEEIVPVIRKTHTIAYSLEPSDNPFGMVGCVHNGLLSMEFCNAFIQLCFDIYVSKTKFHLIQPKIKWHVEGSHGGGICDMTLYHLLASEHILDVLDLNQILMIKGEPCTFDHNINMAVGYKGIDTYLKKGTMKQVMKEGDSFYITERDDVNTHGKKIRALTFHFQGRAKGHMLQVYKNGNC